MKAVLDKFISEIDQLEKYIKFINSINALIKYKPLETDSEKIKATIHSTNLSLDDVSFKKVFEYNSIIVSMYGFFEKFIEDIMIEYLDTLCRYIPEYKKLSASILENHIVLTGQLIQNLKLPKYEKESVVSITQKLNNCLINNVSDLNSVAFTDHTSNFRVNSIAEFFSKVGIKSLSSRIKNEQRFKNFLCRRLGNNVDLSQTKNELIFFILDDLAQRRNDISHGSTPSNSILNNTVLPEYFEFLIEFSICLHKILYTSTLEYECKLNFKAMSFIALYNRNILCLTAENIKIKVGDIIIVKSKKSSTVKFRECIVDEIQVDKRSVHKLSIKGPLNIALKLNDSVKEIDEFYLRKT